ncbi:MucR family transcriptional regulator (plasmid) [Methylobacterium currus]|uniref:MucR family transcriptional regulator n=2 Tax=Methylobacteriaceae TaxID=119045 RepID=A0A2R4WX83_9HYPH|nr:MULTISPECIES: MucR family transcriptional regulator [Methylobacterium]AWB26153.1 MucR family transcriptional regulator [Methylobacterium currus]MBK3397834.1 MucR family transcriptional regulator [Methylobacterium ajmalii]MBK3411171.1 MucR family transcriptional regulator [Methylobacterium ajmalii]MBK3420776.1 MucR family transcriptional regulator [Methylobacterium ajmalii]
MLDTVPLFAREPSHAVGKLSVSQQDQGSSATLVGLAADIVSAYVSKNSLPVAALPDLIASVHTSLTNLGQAVAEEPEKLTPPVPIKKTVTPDYLISLEDGKQYRSLKRHLSTRGLTPEEYRRKWGLPHDYPMVAATYAAQRSELAKNSGLGRPRKAA